MRTWTEQQAYVRQARGLIDRFNENFVQFAGQVSPDVAASGPQPP